MTGCCKEAITKLLCELGTACLEYQDKALRELPCKRIQADESWAFCFKKESHLCPGEKLNGWGDVWTWTAIDADSKLIVSWLVGGRDSGYAIDFMDDLRSRLSNRVQLTTDGHRAYLEAVEGAFGGDIDYAMLTKLYSRTEGTKDERRYSPGYCIGAIKGTVSGNPDHGQVSTSHVERQNLTMRMHMRRFTRLTNGFSKKVENHAYAVALHYMFYNFAKIHKTLRVTPAMQAGISDHIWTLQEIARLAD